MDSVLTPREIQARIRAGESVAEVAAVSGMSIERVEPFAVPVLAERDFVALQARQHQVRRGGETIAHHTLGSVVDDRLSTRGLRPEVASWDAWRLEGRRWAVQVRYSAAGVEREASFHYDQAGRFSVAENDDARWLLGMHAPTTQAASIEAEPTVGLNDELALIRAIQPGGQPEDTEPLDLIEDAFTEGELTEVDGVYDIVAPENSQLDVLYEMLSGFDEDSVRIYAGLVRPVAGGPAAPVVEDGPTVPELDVIEEVEAPSTPSVEPVQPDDSLPPTPKPDPEPPARPEPVVAAAVSEPEQPALTDELDPEPPRPARQRRKRAQVPSWDEIMFGGPLA